MSDYHYPLPRRPRLSPPSPYEGRADDWRIAASPFGEAVGYGFVPTPSWHYVFKRGMTGNGVAVLQLNLAITVDGDFGRLTEAAVEDFQHRRGLTADGIAGGATQRAICLMRFVSPTAAEGLPKGLLASMSWNESNDYLEAYSSHPSDNGYDIGALQLSIGGVGGLLATQDNFRLGYDLRKMAPRTARAIRAKHDEYTGAVGSQYKTSMAHDNNDRMAWDLGVLDHNWPFAANNIHDHGFIHPDDPGRDDRYASWVDSASGGRLTTERQWANAYVEKATVYVRWS